MHIELFEECGALFSLTHHPDGRHVMAALTKADADMIPAEYRADAVPCPACTYPTDPAETECFQCGASWEI